MSTTSENDRNWRPDEKGTLEARSLDDDPPRALSPKDEKRLWRKVDLRLMPILSAMYLLAFMDRGTSDWFSFTIPRRDRCCIVIITIRQGMSVRLLVARQT
jgi:hypothetical protein